MHKDFCIKIFFINTFPKEYLDEEYDPNDHDDEFYLESILPAIRKTIASKSGVHLDDDTKYKVFKKPDNEIEVECTTSDGKVFSVEMVIDPLQQTEISPEVHFAIHARRQRKRKKLISIFLPFSHRITRETKRAI